MGDSGCPGASNAPPIPCSDLAVWKLSGSARRAAEAPDVLSRFPGAGAGPSRAGFFDLARSDILGWEVGAARGSICDGDLGEDSP